MSDLHFGFRKNAFGCSCGRHYGTGNLSPEQRAALLARMRDMMPQFLTEPGAAFLSDFEKCHGRVRYVIGDIGVNTGAFIKENKGQSMIGPIFDSTFDTGRRNAA